MNEWLNEWMLGELPDCGGLADQEGGPADGGEPGGSDPHAEEATQAFQPPRTGKTSCHWHSSDS